MTDPIKEITEIIYDHVENMNQYTLPQISEGFLEGWTHALRLMKRDSSFIAHKITQDLGL